MDRNESTGLTVLYRDEHYIAVNKPAGLLVHRSWIASQEKEFLLQRLRDQIGRRVYPVHRLDRPTSGVLILGLSSEAARSLSQQFEARKVEKIYHTVLRGYSEFSGIIDYPLEEEPGKPRQEAVTAYRRLATVELPFAVGRYATARYSLVEVRPRTGRLHQIRKHFKHINHHLIGDTTHGDGKHNALFREQFNCHRMLLHASRLLITHPQTGAPLDLTAPFDDNFLRLFAEFGWADPLAG